MSHIQERSGVRMKSLVMYQAGFAAACDNFFRDRHLPVSAADENHQISMAMRRGATRRRAERLSQKEN